MNVWIRTGVAAAMLAALSSGASAAATVLNFDDIGTSGYVPVNYGGLDWSAAGWFAFDDVQAPYTPHSGAFRATTDFGGTNAASLIRFNAPATFDGAWFAGLEGATLSFELYLGDTLVASSAVLDPTATPTFLASGYAGLVDRVVIASSEHGGFAMDDFTFTQAVPEPSSYALMLGGLAALAAFKRRQRQG